MPKHSLFSLSERELVQLISEAFVRLDDALWLSASLLADSAAADAAIVPDDAPVNPLDRGWAVRRALAWAVDKLAPGPLPASPATWRDPRWHRYYTLLHGYLKPLEPDDSADKGGQMSALQARMGIASRSHLSAIRQQAFRHIARLFRIAEEKPQQARSLTAAALIQFCEPLQERPSARRLLNLAAVFPAPFPRKILLEAAREVHLPDAGSQLRFLIQHQFLWTIEQTHELRVPGKLRRWLVAQPEWSEAAAWQTRAAAWLKPYLDPVAAAGHLGRAERYAELLAYLTDEVSRLNFAQCKAVLRILHHIPRARLNADELVQLHFIFGFAGLQIRRPPRASDAADPISADTTAAHGQAQAFLRLAQEYSKLHVGKAIEFYQRAADLAPPGHPLWLAAQLGKADLWNETAALPQMEDCLRQTLAVPSTLAPPFKAMAHLLLANAAMLRRDWQQAFAEAQTALFLWESEGNLYYQARSLAACCEITAQLGNIERAQYQAAQCYNRLTASGHQDGPLRRLRTESAVCLAIGRAEEALAVLQQARALAEELGDRVQVFAIIRADIKTRLALGLTEEAAGEWLIAWTLARQLGGGALFESLRRLRADEPVLAGIPEPEDLDRIAQVALDLIREQRDISSHVLARAAAVSVSTASRTLNRLCDQGTLKRTGQGRSTRFSLAQSNAADESRQSAPRDSVEASILDLLARRKRIGLQDILDHVPLSRATVQRSLARLVAAGRLLRCGKGRSVAYVLPDEG